MASSSTFHLCLACQTYYIMGYDLDAICEGCLAPDHACLARSLQPTWPSCRHLPLEKKQQRLAIFSQLEGELPIAEYYPLGVALDVFGAIRESDDSAFKAGSGSIPATLLRKEKPEVGAPSVHGQGLLMDHFWQRACLLACCRTS
ncbi:hypothetical protein ILYODFUR_021301 [Ilyodon furcidens]|uniref:Uncharacterized protein n=1 Tax=Ilyodon furcidens TaxID=33524 RepID=A0ABV0U072_9TELE